MTPAGAGTREANRPGIEAVAVRLLCLGAIVAVSSGVTAVEAGRAEPAEVESFARDVRTWLDGVGATEALTPHEASLLERAGVEVWTERELADASWRYEALGVLLWSLGFLGDLPAWDDGFHGLDEVTPLFDDLAGVISRSRLRDRDDLERRREQAELWNRRARHGRDGGALDRPGMADRLHAKGPIPEPVDGDLPAPGGAYGGLSEDDRHRLASIAVERHLALNWLCGYGERWETTPTDT